MNDNINVIFGGCFSIILIVLLALAFSGWIFMLLWNWLIPLFWTTAPILTYWQACGVILLLSWISFIFKNQSK